MRSLLLIRLWLLLSCPCMAQVFPDSSCAFMKRQSNYRAKTTVASLAEDDYDIKYVKLDLKLTDRNSYIDGNVTTQAQVVKGPMSQYVFELCWMLHIDSVKVNGQLQHADTANNLCTVTITDPLPQGSLFSAQVYYHGFPPLLSPYNSGAGYVHVGNPLYQMSFSLSEPYSSYLWWPCKQSLMDKIDSADTWITVADSLKAGSNGVLASVEPIGNHLLVYKWKERYPIDYYLVSVAVAQYAEYSYFLHFDNSTDSMPVMNYYLDTLYNSQDLATIKKRLDSVGLVINYFSSLFGRYPFWKEKYGHCYSPSFANMEHQTMTTTNYNNTRVVMHELTHQWFGDNVTCASWSDIWLNEGIATYGEYLFNDRFYGTEYARSILHIQHQIIVSNDSGSVYVLDTNEYRTFDGRLTYLKGASVLHMLRFVMNDDSLFFGFLTAYQSKFAGSTATTEDFKQLAQTYARKSLDTFFQQWIYKEGYPTYYSSWNQDNNVLFIKINQVTSVPGSVFTFAMPVAVKLYSPQGDTIVRVYDNQPLQVFEMLMDRPIDSIALDPGEDLICRQGAKPYHEATLNTLPVNITLYPNPVSNLLTIAYRDMLEPRLLLFDAAGRKVMEYKFRWPSGIEQVDMRSFPNAIYVYKIIDKGIVKTEGKLLRQ